MFGFWIYIVKNWILASDFVESNLKTIKKVSKIPPFKDKKDRKAIPKLRFDHLTVSSVKVPLMIKKQCPIKVYVPKSYSKFSNRTNCQQQNWS